MLVKVATGVPAPYFLFLQEFDVFVSYHHQESLWVRQELRPRLEDNEPHFRICLHERDFVLGATVIDNISSAVAISRRMILLLSKAFLQSQWCQTEFREAHYKVSLVRDVTAIIPYK